MKTLCWTVEAGEDGAKLPAYLYTKGELALPSQKKARQLLETGKCSINGQIRTFASALVHTGDKVCVVLKTPHISQEPISILYEDESLFVVDKPAGLQCERSLFEKALRRPCHMVHRLDKETSGLVLVACSEAVAKLLQELFLRREITKKYLAIIDGRLVKAHGEICLPLKLQGRQGSSIYWGVAHDGGKSARTEFDVVIAKNEATLVMLTPHTGRTHQLRVHMAQMGHPILGDYHYADVFSCRLRPDRHLLHAWKLEFVHPVLHRTVRCQSRLPDDFQEYAKRLFGGSWEEKL